MNGYSALARFYDRFTSDVDHPAWADYLERQFSHASRPIRTVLDLACGTGTLTWILAERGYDMTGVDLSPDMLMQASEKAKDHALSCPPLFLCQSMDRLDLYDTVDACICCLDSINHVSSLRQLQKVFQRIHLFLSPGGIFVFDVYTPEALQGMDGSIYMDEDDDVCCIWRADYDRRRRRCTFGVDLFQRRGELWSRESESHDEYAYAPEDLTALLKQAGFEWIRRYGPLKYRSPREGDQRIFFAARKGLSYHV